MAIFDKSRESTTGAILRRFVNLLIPNPGYYPRLLEPWISPEHSSLDSELILYLLYAPILTINEKLIVQV